MPHAARENYNQYIRNYLKRRYDRRHPIAIKLLGGKCVVCNSTERLQFDHIDHSKKVFDIADRLAQYTWKRILPELAKCQLLCFECHLNKSSIENSGHPMHQHGTPSMYRRGCRCESCRDASRKMNSEYIAKRKAIKNV